MSDPVADLILRWRKLAETRELTERQKATVGFAREDARRLGAVAGPHGIAAEYQIPMVNTDDEEIAQAYARAAYNPWAFEAAVLGALEGFAEFNRG